MQRPNSSGPSPHRCEFDPARFEGCTTLGEPLGVLFSALLRLQFGDPHDGLMPLWATWTSEEGLAIERAMGGVEKPRTNDTRTTGERDTDRFMAVAMHVMRAAEGLRP